MDEGGVLKHDRKIADALFSLDDGIATYEKLSWIALAITGVAMALLPWFIWDNLSVARAEAADYNDKVQFVCGETWVSFRPIGMTEPPRTDIRPIVNQVWTIPKDQILRAFSSSKTGHSYLYSRFEGKRMLVYVAPDTYWKIVECLN